MNTSPDFSMQNPLCVMTRSRVVGTINLDYRSLYLHFEDGVWIYGNDVIWSMKEDFVQTLEDCHTVPLEFCKNRKIPVRIMQNVLRAFAPML